MIIQVLATKAIALLYKHASHHIMMFQGVHGKKNGNEKPKSI